MMPVTELPFDGGSSSLIGVIVMSPLLSSIGASLTALIATVLVAGSVGSVFGLSGLKVGQRIGRVVSKRVEWDKLGKGHVG